MDGAEHQYTENKFDSVVIGRMSTRVVADKVTHKNSKTLCPEIELPAGPVTCVSSGVKERALHYSAGVRMRMPQKVLLHRLGNWINQFESGNE